MAIHSHDQGRLPAGPSPAVVDFARSCIDSGADAVAVHGAHVVRGDEMHRDRPILHGLGSLFFQPETVPFLPDEAFRLHGLPLEATVADLFTLRWGNGKRSLASRRETWQGLIAVADFGRGRADVDLVPTLHDGDRVESAHPSRPKGSSMRSLRMLAASVAVVVASFVAWPASASAAAVDSGHRHTTEVLRIWHPAVTPTSVSGSGLGTVRTYFTPMTVNGVAQGYMTGTLTTVAADASTQIEWRTSNLVFVMDASNVNQVVVGGVLTYSSTSAVLGVGQTFLRPVLGGSGAYANVTGYVASVNRGDGGWLHVFHLRS